MPDRFLRPGEKLDEELLAEGEKVLRRVDSKIRVVESPEVPGDLLADVEGLRRAVAAEDHEAVLRRLYQLVPDYQPLLPEDSSAMIRLPDVSPVM